MVEFSPQRVQSIFEGFRGKRIGVVGDLMMDRYYWGSVLRISPEAPVPVVEVESESTRLGGAANVANNVATLGGIPLMIGVIGNDPGGRLLEETARQEGFSTVGLVVDPSRPTTIKTRVIAHNQHVVRIDQEVKHDIGSKTQDAILDVLKREIDSLDAIILEDYNKGAIARDLIHAIVGLARKKRKVITVDPKFNNFFEYKDVTVFKPNRKESEEALGRRLVDVQSIEQAGSELLRRLNAESVLLTLGEKGMSLFEQSGTVTHVSTQAKHVADVSGAGDTVISTLTMSLVGGASIKEASTLANYAGGVVCGEVGIVPIEREVLLNAIMDNHRPRFD
ncbi:MAG: D-glycero-beta-D-manno-heptose-7-phosphate kinase [Ignavibacteriales bacterium]|nr:D-glycero-beta-D-manno-heptose-7-phosphate kinase [Ignavibacteriales bacterium]